MYRGRNHIMTESRVIDDMNNIIGKNIRSIRLQQNIGQTELVRELQLNGVNITRETLVKIERGIQHIKLSQLKGICKLLGVTYDDILGKSLDSSITNKFR